MERTLIVVRHGHATLGVGSDEDRPLSPRGIEQCDALGTRLARFEPAPDVVLCSKARRTRETARAMNLDSGRVRVSDALYLASPNALREAVESVDDAVRCVLVIAHNPGLSAWVDSLASADSLATADARVLVGEGDSWAAAIHGPWQWHPTALDG